MNFLRLNDFPTQLFFLFRRKRKKFKKRLNWFSNQAYKTMYNINVYWMLFVPEIFAEFSVWDKQNIIITLR